MKNIIFVLILAILVSGCISSDKYLNKEEIVNEINRLDELISNKTIEPSDVQKLKELTKNDHIASHYSEEIEWLVDHNRSNHATHSLGYLFTYIQFGEYKPCAPHETEHLVLYAEYNDTEKLEHKLEEINEILDIWLSNFRRDFSNNRPLLEKIENSSTEIRDIVDHISAGGRNITILEKAEYLSDSGLC